MREECPEINFRNQLMRKVCPEIDFFRNIRFLSIDQWESFNTSMGELENGVDIDDSNDAQGKKKKKRKIHSPHSYHYIIGDYESSTYYVKFLSDRRVRVPFQNDCTVRELTHCLSKNPKSTFRSWF